MVWQPVEYQSCPPGILTYTDHAPTSNSRLYPTESKAMRKDVNELIVHAQDLLEKGLQKCIGLTKGLIRNLEKKVKREVGYRLLSNTELQEELTNVSGELYEVMAKTLFNLIPALQPEDCESGKAINFYFWPGYHSVLIDKRIFVEQEDKNSLDPEKPNRWNFGVGICGRPEEQLSIYHDSCQARLFHFFIKPRNQSHITPLDIHHLMLRRAADHKDDLSRFLVVTNQARPMGATPDSYFELSSKQNSEGWGFQLDEFVRENWTEKLQRATRRNKDEEVMPFKQYAQNKMQSLWLHSAFCDFEPKWLPSFVEELGLHLESRALKSSLNQALADDVATKWGDWNQNRPLFSSWVNLSLSPWLDPRDMSLGDDEPPARKPKWASRTVGSAAFLSSVPVRPLYLAFAKQWVNEVYNALRNAEMAMLLFNKKLHVLEAIHAGPYFSHEIQTLVEQALPTVQRQIAKNNENAIQTRRFLLYSIRTLCTLAYSFTRVVLSTKDYEEERKKNLLQPLNELRASKALLPNLTSIAKETYESLKVGGGGIVVFEGCSQAPDMFVDDLQYGACFLLIVELFRNYCHSDRSGPTATFRTRLDGDILLIELEGATQAERKPMSMSVARLNRFLRVLGIGQVTMDWDAKLKWFKSTVRVNLDPDSATRNQFS